jgi:hypothetical protein
MASLLFIARKFSGTFVAMFTQPSPTLEEARSDYPDPDQKIDLKTFKNQNELFWQHCKNLRSE